MRKKVTNLQDYKDAKERKALQNQDKPKPMYDWSNNGYLLYHTLKGIGRSTIIEALQNLCVNPEDNKQAIFDTPTVIKIDKQEMQREGVREQELAYQVEHIIGVLMGNKPIVVVKDSPKTDILNVLITLPSRGQRT